MKDTLFIRKLVATLTLLAAFLVLLATQGNLHARSEAHESALSRLWLKVLSAEVAMRPATIPQGLTPSEWQSIQTQIAPGHYFKASNPDLGDWFGWTLDIDGDTLVVGAPNEASNATGIDGNQGDNSVELAGAAYVFVRDGNTWTQQAYLKASNTDSLDKFGNTVSISGNTIVVGAFNEASNATGINGDQSNNSAFGSGAAYVFVRNGNTWSQQAYLKASNTDIHDNFGRMVDISGNTIVVGAPSEASNATGVDGDQGDNSLVYAGAAYVFVRDGNTWTQQAYLKASNTDSNDGFGMNLAISDDTVIVGAPREDSNATGVDGDQGDNSVNDAGAAYIFVRNGTTWSQQAYLKAADADEWDNFGDSVDVSGNTAVVGMSGDDSNATGIDGDPSDNSAFGSGAAYVFVRDGNTWTQQAYLKASNTNPDDGFGMVGIAGNTVIVGASFEDSNATGVNGNQGDNSAPNSGAAYLFVRNGTTWSQQAYLKASNTDSGDFFGLGRIEGMTVIVGAQYERSNATGVDGDQSDNSLTAAGAVYSFANLTAVDDLYRTPKNTTLVTAVGNGVLSNDALADPNTTASLITSPITGTFDFVESGAFSYIPPTNFEGVMSFTYQAEVGLPLTATARILVGDVVGPADVALSHAKIRENYPEGTIIGDFTVIDPTSSNHTYTLVSGKGSENNDEFTITNNQLLTNAIFDYEAGQSPLRRIRVRASNGTLWVEKVFTIRIENEVNEPAGQPDQCNGNALTLYMSDNGKSSAILENVTVSHATVLGCKLDGTLTVQLQGQTITTQSVSGKVSRWNKFSLTTNALNNFDFDMAGITVKTQSPRLNEYSGQMSIVFGKVDVCAPVEWGGDCVDGTPSHLRLDASGLFAGNGFPMPDFLINQSATGPSPDGLVSPLGQYTSLLMLSAKFFGKAAKDAKLTEMSGGYEITIPMGLALPKIPLEQGCGIMVTVTLFRSTSGAVMMEIEPANTPEGVEFREGKVGMFCKKGIPIGTTGLQLSGVEGTLSLRPDLQFVKLNLQISLIAKPKLFKAMVGASLFWQPEWGVDLSGSAKTLYVFDLGGFEAKFRETYLSFKGNTNAVVIQGQVTFNAWWPNGRFHFSGSGKVKVGFPEGAILEDCAYLPWPIDEDVCLTVPPFDTTVTNVIVEGGEFTNGNYGFKGFARLLQHYIGFYIDTSGDVHVGGVSQYQLATPLMIDEARTKWEQQRELIATGQAEWNDPLSFPADDQMLLTVQINPTDVISQVTVATPSDTIFVVSALDPLTVTLESPSGNVITPANAATYNTTYSTTTFITGTIVYTQYLYIVSAAEIGDWLVSLEGDTATHSPILGVYGLANAPAVQSATLASASDLSQVEVNWSLSSDLPVTVMVYATAGEITSTITVTDSNNMTTTEVISNYNGIPVATFPVSQLDQLQKAQTLGLVDLTDLESNTYALWLEIDNGLLPGINQYVTVTGTQEVAWIDVDNTAGLPVTWTAVLTPTVEPFTGQILITAKALTHPDVDSYAFNISQTPNNPEDTFLGYAPQYRYDANGNPVGVAHVRVGVNNVRPGETYYLSLIAVDEQSDWSVQSQEIAMTVSAGDYTLTTPQSSYQVNAGTAVTLTIPVSLNILQPLFYPEVALELDTFQLPRGIVVVFEDDPLGATNLDSETTSVNLIVTVEPTTPEGYYHFNLLGLNGDNNKIVPLTIQVGNPSIYLPVAGKGVKFDLYAIEMGLPYPNEPISTTGGIFYTQTVQLPADLPDGGSFYLSSSRALITPVSVDDRLILSVNGSEIFSHDFSTSGPAAILLDTAVAAQMEGQTVTIYYQDVHGNQQGATAVWLVWIP